jgi:hypothetical protein
MTQLIEPLEAAVGGMFLIVVVTLFVILPAVLAALLLWVAGRRSIGDDAAARSARRHEALIAVASVVAAVATVVAVLSVPVTWSPRRLGGAGVPGGAWAAGPFVVALAYCGVRAAGELTWPRPRGAVRTAPLQRRTVADLGGWRLRWLLATAALLVVTLVVTGLTAAPDGRSVPHPVRITDDGGVMTGASGPYPGWAYGVPMLVGLALALLATVVTLRLIARRAPLGGLARWHDDAVRRTSAARTLAGVQVCLGGTVAALMLVAGGAVANALGSVDPSGETVRSPGVVVLVVTIAVVGLAVGAASVAGAVTAVVHRTPVAPGGRTPADETEGRA